ncbi:beta strand repeat-containing protein [Deinococcus humi]|uniref:Uncharacterized protein n=1 Tax=Deinococcus humi TaxID=662880 RepID=A0A7W8JZP3_9DEIO|nr:hypothetical protein [Deinococcus humi]MBB5366162.1 hypothetical protein [Deinococcus humi]GGO40682.1 hypothetical protein GCM10008949_50430 [Deinococcus humi]
MNAPLVRLGLPLLSLSLLLAACGGGGTVNPPPGTPITSTADSGPGTLRELLDSAGAGDTLRLDSGTITLVGPLKVTKSVTLNLGSSVIDANSKGRALEIPSGVTVTITGGTLKGGTGAPITLANVGQQELTVATYGGVLVNEGTLTLDGTTVTGGKANMGGGIANLKGGTLTLKGNSNVTGNTAQVLPENKEESSGGGGGIFNKGTLEVEAGSVSTNTATYSGGGIYGGVGSATTISGGKVDGNTVTAPVVQTETNTTGSAGGGIYSNGEVTITGGSVSGNTASYFGGGITVQSTLDAQGNLVQPKITMSGGSIENNRLTDTMNAGVGGGMWTNGDLTMTGGTVKGNMASYGGGFVVYRNASITGGTFEGNTASKSGGGLLLITPASRATNSTVTFGGTATVKGNSSGEDGGGISVSRTILTMTGGTVTGNTTVNTGGGISLGGGTNSTIEGGVISNNKATGSTDGGGGVRVFSNGKLTLSGGAISGNSALRTGGGLVVGGQVTMTGGEISSNTVTGKGDGQGSGGGVQMYASSTFTASGGSIKDNTAWYGGGVFVGGAYENSPGGQFALSGATVSGNKATDGNVGGGFFNDGKLTISSGSVTGNTAPRSGGGVFNSKRATYAQPGGSVTGNNPDNVFNEP